MTHEVQTPVVADDAVAFTEACCYPDGTNVLGATVLELAGGRIVRQVVVQAWDELKPTIRTRRQAAPQCSQSTKGVSHEP
jgi:hypothetical protein